MLNRLYIRKQTKRGTMDYQNLYTTHYKHIYYICLKFLKNPQDAEDMTQNVFMKAFNKIDTLENKESFKKLCQKAQLFL